ncbi:unnamed protein product, partial [Adineta steineri]
MDEVALLHIPKLSDDKFLSKINEDVDETFSDMTSLIMTSKATVFDDKKLDEELILQRGIEESWEELVVAGPIVVNYIGNLMILSSKQDFPFRPSNPAHVYQHIQYPKSFRTTLVQIAHRIYNVFMNAHSNMDRIQLNI